MRIEDLKRWHWCVVGVIVGSLVAAVSLWAGPAAGNDPRVSTAEPHVIESQLLQKTDPSKRKVAGVRNVRVHPGDADAGPGEFASYEVLLRRPKDPVKCDVARWRLVMRQSTHRKSVLGEIKGMSARDYLAKLKAYTDDVNKKYPGAAFTLDYRYNWLETPAGAFSVYPAAGLILIGGIWPSVLGLLIGAGFGKPHAEDEFDLSKYRSGREPAKKKKAGLTHADAEELARLEAELEAKLRSGDIGATSEPSDGETDRHAGRPRVLEAGPLEQPKAPATPAKAKGYGADQGDFYPTEVHGKPKH